MSPSVGVELSGLPDSKSRPAELLCNPALRRRINVESSASELSCVLTDRDFYKLVCLEVSHEE